MTQPVTSSPAPTHPQPVTWADPARAAAFTAWLADEAPRHGLHPASLSLASADASFRRYLRVDSVAGPRIIMDAPPDKENCVPFVQVAELMAAAGLNVPQVLAWQQAQGFMLLSDLGAHTMMSVLDPQQPQAAAPLYSQATDALVQWQKASRPGVLPVYDEALLRRELALFPDWYLGQYRQFQMDDSQRNVLDKAFSTIVQHNLAAPQVFVHRDFMARNLMLGQAEPGALPGPLGVLDFQDAVYGPITYDIASLMRDAFLTWEEDFVIDVTVRYWEKARKAGLMDFEDWHSDFGAFYRGVEWMGLQRHLKVAGIFARLTLRDGKPRYLADTPRFIHYIRSTANRYRALGPLLKFIDQVENIQTVSGYAYGRV
ncbi:phosphotransferase [Curvibacter sp. RS43]|uniref:Phosphotransferase n=1 Tax=Curvibacter microcysteis TaxID=3026419 RepID=A0ABT5MLI6_9BURK|nr:MULTISPECIES: phosphotransferase [unclassified Curvibacter]MDD0811014.1 phosphotransferase [Curvibacter sp. RS43]MDD0816031.1 phosphotransferase [Curvibacter sp. HBC28]